MSKRPRRFAPVALLLVILPLLLAMGTGGSEGPVTIPEPSSDFRARLTDQEGMVVELSQVAVQGQVFVLGRLGQGEAAVPFDKIRTLTVTNQGRFMKVVVQLKDGRRVTVMVKPGLTLTGRTSFGNYRIPFSEISRLEILGRNLQPTKAAGAGG